MPIKTDRRDAEGHLQCLAPELALKFANALLQLPDDLVSGDCIVLGVGDTPHFEHEPSPTIQQVRCDAIA